MMIAWIRGEIQNTAGVWCKESRNKTKVISADLLEFDFDLDLNFYDIF